MERINKTNKSRFNSIINSIVGHETNSLDYWINLRDTDNDLAIQELCNYKIMKINQIQAKTFLNNLK